MRLRLMLIPLVFVLSLFGAAGRPLADTSSLKIVQLPNGIRLHYISEGSGPAMVLIHGSISDYTYWNSEVAYFRKYYHVVAYSRRYNYPNHNLTRPGYSAKSDAEDLAELIKILNLRQVIIVGDSYGALAALFFAVHHPEMTSKMVLAEPPAVSLLDNLSGSKTTKGKKLKKEIDQKMVVPMRRDFKAGDSEKGIADFINYVFKSRSAWKRTSTADKNAMLRNSYEWEVMLTAGVFFPAIDKKSLTQIKVPVLLLSGGKWYHFINLTDAELHRDIPNNSQVIFAGAGDRLWYRRTAECRRLTMDFLKGRIANHKVITER